MSYIHISYDSIADLVSKFQTLEPQIAADRSFTETANFVLIHADDYYGSYGGLVYDSVWKLWKNNKQFYPSSIGYGVSIVWWDSQDPDSCGDLYALNTMNGELVAVTPDIFKRLRRNPIKENSSVTSSYYRVNLDY